ncbi:MAG: glutamate formimidoyltransferase [Pseudomonadota bacterium]
MIKIVECVPNFSEGCDQNVIDAIADAVKSVNGVALLDVDPGKATNRTVFTFAGSPEVVLEAAFQAIKKGCELIDMRHHKGEHARQGACDVCPFVPVSNVTMDECVELAKRLGKRVGEELDIPVYLYAEAAQIPERKKMPDIRVGEYEALEEKLKKPEWKPDFGPAEFRPKAGVITTGARKFLIAYNINLNSTNTKLAKEIAFTIRENGRLKKDADGNTVIGQDGKKEREPGLFKHVQATGWLIPEYNRAQVTMNILDIDETPLHLVYDKCCELATNLGCRVTGSEIVGMVPKQVMTEAGLYFLKKQGSTRGVTEEEIIRNAMITLGLNDVAPFDPKEKIIERRFEMNRPLIAMTCEKFCAELSSNSPAPGGGSVAALSGALSTALSSMVASLTFDKKGFEKVKPEMEKAGMEAQKILKEQLEAIDDDTFAFNKVMDSFSMPKGTDEQKAKRASAIQEATKNATLVPLNTLKRTIPSLKLALEVVEKGNPNSLSDSGVAALTAEAAANGAYYNVMINLASIDDKKWVKKTKDEAVKYLGEAAQLAEKIKSEMMKKLEAGLKKI